jgi:hypothetical protein
MRLDEEVEGAEWSSSRTVIGSSVISVLGIVFGSSLIVSGSALTWKSDHILGIYNQSGWSFHNVISGDGKVTMALGALMAIGFVLGVVLQSRAAYAVACVADILVAAFALYEVIFMMTRQGVVGPGNGLYMVLGGSVAGFLCALGGYLMMAERHRERHPGAEVPLPEPSGSG